jgi:phosphatidylinositol 3-kinase
LHKGLKWSQTLKILRFSFVPYSGTLEGINQKKPSYEKLLEDPLLRFSGLYYEECATLMVKCQIFNKGVPGLAICSSYKPFITRFNWNEWITLPMQYSDLPRTAMLALTILDCAGPSKTTIVGGTTISMFDKKGMFRQGMFDLRVWPNVEADGNESTTTPGKGKDDDKNQMQRLAKLVKKHPNGQIQKMDWLDRLTFPEISRINEQEKKQSDNLFLMIEFPAVLCTDSDKPVSTT